MFVNENSRRQKQKSAGFDQKKAVYFIRFSNRNPVTAVI